MNRNVTQRLLIAAVALVLVLPFTVGCDDNTTKHVVQGALTATYTPEADPTDGSVSLQAGAAPSSSDRFNVDVVVGAVDNIAGINIKIHFNQYFTEFVSGDFTGSFLQGSLPAAEFDTGAELFHPGVVDVWAARRGAAQSGITMATGATGTLCTLTFKAIAATTGDPAADLVIDDTDITITVCPTGGGACTTTTVTLSGGSMTAV